MVVYDVFLAVVQPNSPTFPDQARLINQQGHLMSFRIYINLQMHLCGLQRARHAVVSILVGVVSPVRSAGTPSSCPAGARLSNLRVASA